MSKKLIHCTALLAVPCLLSLFSFAEQSVQLPASGKDAGSTVMAVQNAGPTEIFSEQAQDQQSDQKPGSTPDTQPQSSNPPATAKPADDDPVKATTPQDQNNTSGTSKDRLFFALPNFLTLENAGQVPPLTAKEKFRVVARGSFDYVQYPWYGFLSGISQWEDSEPGFGQGAEGYAKRFGAAFADGTIENFFTGAIFPAVLHEDPRYFELGHGSFMHRTLYAMSRNLITRTDSGKNQFNFSEVLGGAVSAAVSTYSYHPKSHVFFTPKPPYSRFVASDRTLMNTASVWGTQYGYDTLTLVIKEFWPDIRRKIKHQRNVALTTPGDANGEGQYAH